MTVAPLTSRRSPAASRRRWAALLAAFALLAAASCAPKAPPVTPGGAPKFASYPFPQVPPDLQRTQAAAARAHQDAWAALQAGDLRGAERRLTILLKQQPAFYPANAALGYVELARRDPRKGLEYLDRALARADRYASALVGRGEALLALKQDADALDAFERALAADPSLTDVRRRVEVLKFRDMQEAITGAQAAAREGRLEEARAGYRRAIDASPESGFLYRELAGVERRLGNLDEAAAGLHRAVALNPGDGAAWLQLADVLEQREAWDEALEALRKAQALEAAPGLDARVEALEQRAAVARLPAEYRAIPETPRLTRGDLAALIGVRLDGVLRLAAGRGTVVATDTRGHWAQTWILAVTRAGIMDVYSNHTFQPRATVRRIDLAQVTNRLLTVIAATRKDAVPALRDTRVFPDLGQGHMGYRAAAQVVAAGVMPTADGGAFEPSRAVTGTEAVEAVERVQALAAKAGIRRGFSTPESRA